MMKRRLLPCRGPQGPLSLFRLQGVGRHLHLPGREGRPELSRGGRAAGAEAGLQMPELTQDDEPREKQRATLYDVMEMPPSSSRGELQAAARRQGARLSRRSRPAGAVQPEFRPRLCARTTDRRCAATLPPGHRRSNRWSRPGSSITGDDIPVAYDRFRDRIIFPIRDGARPGHRLWRPGALQGCAGRNT